ncbi:hypothetical protein EDD85DRAFT_798283 [Armillaria nabsnona]|nr:hypothetical protein EDD85DRAFT_798283 [Armillaria nabsnona]
MLLLSTMFVRSLSLLSLVAFTIANGLGDGNALQDAFDAMDGTFDNIRGALSVFSTNVDVSHATAVMDGINALDTEMKDAVVLIPDHLGPREFCVRPLRACVQLRSSAFGCVVI